jgi:hypothetical protein
VILTRASEKVPLPVTILQPRNEITAYGLDGLFGYRVAPEKSDLSSERTSVSQMVMLRHRLPMQLPSQKKSQLLPVHPMVYGRHRPQSIDRITDDALQMVPIQMTLGLYMPKEITYRLL